MQCWKDRNNSIYGATRLKSRQIEIANAHASVRLLYQNPPTLATEFEDIRLVPL